MNYRVTLKWMRDISSLNSYTFLRLKLSEYLFPTDQAKVFVTLILSFGLPVRIFSLSFFRLKKIDATERIPFQQEIRHLFLSNKLPEELQILNKRSSDIQNIK